MIKKFLIVGASSGIGKAISEYFEKKNMCVETVSRTGNPTYRGDITDEKFRNFLFSNCIPDVLIMSAGIFSTDLERMIQVNASSSIEMINFYYKNMKPGSNIIVISSIAATMSENLYVSGNISINAYACAKKALTDFSLNLSMRKERDIRISVIEPHDVRPTNIIKARQQIKFIPGDEYNFNAPRTIDVDYIAEVSDWILNQPRWITISKLLIDNNFHRKNLES